MKNSAGKWAADNKFGRNNANIAIRGANESGNIPMLVAAIREASKHESGENVGFLFEIAESAIRNK